jgi:hypothetical protein
MLLTERTGTKAVEDYWNTHNPKPLKRSGLGLFLSLKGSLWGGLICKKFNFVRRDLIANLPRPVLSPCS